MLKKLVAALLAAAAFAPAAMAQEGAHENNPNAGISRRGELRAMRERGGDEGQRPQFNRGGNGGQRPQFQRPAEQPAQFRPESQRAPDQSRPAFRPQPQAGSQQQPAWRGYGDRGPRGNMFVERAQRQQAEDRARADGRFRDRSFVGSAAPGEAPAFTGRRGAPFDANQRRGGDRRFDDRRRAGDRNWNNGRFGQPNYAWNGRNDWSRQWRGDNRYDWGRYRQQNRNIFRLPRYYAPYDWNYGYRRFSIGVTLSSLLWSQDYWIDDPSYYRLPPAYGPYRWVRYYNDALLVDIETGEVVDTVYDIFW